MTDTNLTTDSNRDYSIQQTQQQQPESEAKSTTALPQGQIAAKLNQGVEHRSTNGVAKDIDARYASISQKALPRTPGTMKSLPPIPTQHKASTKLPPTENPRASYVGEKILLGDKAPAKSEALQKAEAKLEDLSSRAEEFRIKTKQEINDISSQLNKMQNRELNPQEKKTFEDLKAQKNYEEARLVRADMNVLLATIEVSKEEIKSSPENSFLKDELKFLIDTQNKKTPNFIQANITILQNETTKLQERYNRKDLSFDEKKEIINEFKILNQKVQTLSRTKAAFQAHMAKEKLSYAQSHSEIQTQPSDVKASEAKYAPKPLPKPPNQIAPLSQKTTAQGQGIKPKSTFEALGKLNEQKTITPLKAQNGSETPITTNKDVRLRRDSELNSEAIDFLAEMEGIQKEIDSINAVSNNTISKEKPPSSADSVTESSGSEDVSVEAQTFDLKAYEEITAKATDTMRQIDEMEKSGGALIAESKPKKSMASAIKRKISDTTGLFQGSKKITLSNADALHAARDSLQQGIEAQEKRIQNVNIESSNISKDKYDAKYEAYLATIDEIDGYSKTKLNFEVALDKLNNSQWAKDVQNADQTPTLQEIKNVEKDLKIHTLPDTVIIAATSTEPKESFLVKHLKEQMSAEKEVILSPDTPEKSDKLTTMHNSRGTVLKKIVDDAIKTQPRIETGESYIEQSMAVSEELSSLDRLMNAHPDFVAKYPEFKAHTDSLIKAFENPDMGTGQLQKFSAAAKSLEKTFLFQQEADGLMQPEKVAARSLAHEVEQKSKELDQIIDTFEKESKGMGTSKVSDLLGSKIVYRNDSDTFELKSRKIGFSKGTSQEAADTFNALLGKLENLPSDPSLKAKGKEILGLIENDSRFVGAQSTDAELKTLFDKVKANLEAIPAKRKEAASATEMKAQAEEATRKFYEDLLNPPANLDFQNAFLNSYVASAKTLSGDSSTAPDSQKLFSFLTTQFLNPETSLYGKQQILKLASQWINDPYLNNYELNKGNDEVSVLGEQIKQLASFAANDGSPTLKELSNSLVTDLQNAEKLSEPSLQVIQGEKSLDTLTKEIRAGTLKPGTKLYQDAVKDVAASFTLQSTHLFNSITINDFKDFGKSENIKNCTQNYNSTTFYVIDAILGSPVSKDQPLSAAEKKSRLEQGALVAEFFINVQNELLSGNSGIVDLSSSLAIQAAFRQGPIERLNIFDKVPSKIRDARDNNEKFFDTRFVNSRKEIQKLSNNGTSVLPYLGMYQSDFTFGKEANATMLNNMVKQFGNTSVKIGQLQNNLQTEEQKLSYDLSSLANHTDKGNALYDISYAIIPSERKTA